MIENCAAATVSMAMDIGLIWEQTLSAARRLAADPDARYVVLIRPNRTLMCIACPPAGSMPPDRTRPMEQVVSSTVKRSVAVIAPTEFATGQPADGADQSASDLAAANQAIPFFGMLSGLAYIGHAVWVFDGQPAALQPACRYADLLLIDSFYAGKLTTKTVSDAASVMRNANILVHDRATYGLKAIRKVGQSKDLEFL